MRNRMNFRPVSRHYTPSDRQPFPRFLGPLPSKEMPLKEGDSVIVTGGAFAGERGVIIAHDGVRIDGAGVYPLKLLRLKRVEG